MLEASFLLRVQCLIRKRFLRNDILLHPSLRHYSDRRRLCCANLRKSCRLKNQTNIPDSAPGCGKFLIRHWRRFFPRQEHLANAGSRVRVPQPRTIAGTKQEKVSLVSGFPEFPGFKPKALSGQFGNPDTLKTFAFFAHISLVRALMQNHFQESTLQFFF